MRTGGTDRGGVLVATPDFPPAIGGIQLLFERLVQAWRRIGVSVVTLDAPGARELDWAAEIPVRRVPVAPLFGRKATIARLNAAALSEAVRRRPRVILSGHVVVAPAAVAARKTLGVPYVQYAFGAEIAGRPGLARFGFKRADAVIALSRFTERLALEHGAHADRVHLIPPGVDLSVNGREPRSDRPTVVTVARLGERYKGHDVLLRAMPLVRARVPRVRLILVGDGPLRPGYESLASALGVSDCVEFRGAVGDVDRDRLLREAHLFALPSRLSPDGGGEGFGIVYLEAARHGLPVVAGNVGGATDAVVDGESGLLVDPADHNAVAQAITTLLSDPARNEAYGRRALERARSFAWPEVAKRVEEVLLSVARDPR
jgi:phosphatidyl-myo-inositol dimannoside synthase